MTRRIKGFGRPPSKGSKLREFLLRCLRREGVTSDEASDIFSKSALGAAIIKLRDEKGYDVRGFPCPQERRMRASKKPPLVYRCVGKMFWNCKYRSFVNAAAETRESA